MECDVYFETLTCDEYFGTMTCAKYFSKLGDGTVEGETNVGTRDAVRSSIEYSGLPGLQRKTPRQSK